MAEIRITGYRLTAHGGEPSHDDVLGAVRVEAIVNGKQVTCVVPIRPAMVDGPALQALERLHP